MSQLLKAFNTDGDFDREFHFTLTFDVLPSSLYLQVPLKANKDNMDKVLNELNLSDKDYELVFKVWDTEDWNDTDLVKDFPYRLLFKSTKIKEQISISLRNDTLFIEFLYDCSDAELEKKIVKKNHDLRKRFGMSSAPTFNVLTKARGGFKTEEVRTEKITLDLNKNYNDDFLEVAEQINQAIINKKSGLILLYGKPGTGKTTYIKSLLSTYQKYNFIFIPNEFINNLLDPEFVSFLLKQRNSILVLEDAEKVISSRDNMNKSSVVSTLLQLTDGLFSDYLNIKVISTFNTSISKIDSALLRKGRMIAMYEFNALSVEKTNLLLQETGGQTTDKSLYLADIYNPEQANYANIEKKRIGF